MAERNPGDATGLSAIVNVALIVVTIAGFLTLVRQELTSDRPPPPPNSEDGGIGSQTVDVRLWEDPLRLSKKHQPQDLPALVDQIRHSDLGRGTWLLPVMVPGGPYSEDQESRIRTRFAVVSALVEASSIRAACRMTGIAKNSVVKLLAEIGQACAPISRCTS